MSARSFMIPAWTETVASLKAEDGVRVYQKCSACSRESIVDLDALIEEFGPLYSLWNRHPPCEDPRCAGKRWFRAQPANYFHKILEGAPAYLVEPLHERWKASLPADVRDTLPVLPMMEATGFVVLVGCGACDISATLAAVEVQSWGAGITLLDLTQRVACREGCEIALDLAPRPRDAA